MSHNIEDKETTPSSSGENIRPEGVSDKRRHLIKGIGATAPLMMTIASRPVLGAQCTPSAWFMIWINLVKFLVPVAIFLVMLSVIGIF